MWPRSSMVISDCRRRGRFRGNPVYHVAINWKEGEHPTAAPVERTSQHVIKALGVYGMSDGLGLSTAPKCVLSVLSELDQLHNHGSRFVQRIRSFAGTLSRTPDGRRAIHLMVRLHNRRLPEGAQASIELSRLPTEPSALITASLNQHASIDQVMAGFLNVPRNFLQRVSDLDVGDQTLVGPRV